MNGSPLKILLDEYKVYVPNSVQYAFLLSWAGITTHAVNSNKVQILEKNRLDWFVISFNLEIGFLRIKSKFLKGQVNNLYKVGLYPF